MTPAAMNLRHLHREVATALELALVALAPNPTIEALASAAGLLDALQELPFETEALAVWVATAVDRGVKSLATWHAWEAERKAIA